MCSMQAVFHDVEELTQKLFPIVEAMQKHFSAGSGAYYSDAIFFLSVAMHHIMPQGTPALTPRSPCQHEPHVCNGCHAVFTNVGFEIFVCI